MLKLVVDHHDDDEQLNDHLVLVYENEFFTHGKEVLLGSIIVLLFCCDHAEDCFADGTTVGLLKYKSSLTDKHISILDISCLGNDEGMNLC